MDNEDLIFLMLLLFLHLKRVMEVLLGRRGSMKIYQTKRKARLEEVAVRKNYQAARLKSEKITIGRFEELEVIL